MTYDMWDVYQNFRIKSLRRDVSAADSTAHRAEEHLVEMQASLERLSLVCQAMWELLRERVSISEEELLEKVREIDLRDGRLDGRAMAPPRKCPKCSRANNGRRQKCLYCGTDIADDAAFKRV